MTARQIIEARLGRPVRRKDGILLGVRGMTHDHIADAITAHYGPRCPDTEPGCPCCDAWAQYDALRDDQATREAAEDLATAYMAGRYDGRVAVRVKPVVWEKVVYRRSDEDPTEEWDGEFEAAPLGLCYEITMAFGTDSYVWDVRGPDFNDLGAFDSLEAAKAAAQADYEARILAAVEAVDLRPIREALECINRVLHFDLRRMIEFGDDYNQAVKDAADAATAARQALKGQTNE